MLGRRGEPLGIEGRVSGHQGIEARTCLLATHADTLFTIFEPDVRAAGLRDTGRLVTRLITGELAREGLPAGTFGRPHCGRAGA